MPDTPDTPDPGNNGNGNSAGNNGQGNGNSAGNGDGNGSINKTSTVIKDFVVDYNTETFEPLTEHEVNGLDYKYVYGNDRLSVDISPIDNSMKLVENGDHARLYYHMDYLGTADYLTSPVSGKVEAWTHYNEWGLIVHNAVLKCGQRELDLVKRYATHDYDSVLELYYAKARFYDAHDRHFTAVDPILDPSQYDLREYVSDPVQLVQYLYVGNKPLTSIDLLGLCFFDNNGNWRHDNRELNGGYQVKSNPRGKGLLLGDKGHEVEKLRKLPRNNLEVDGRVGPKTGSTFFRENVVGKGHVTTSSNNVSNDQTEIYKPESLQLPWPTGDETYFEIEKQGISLAIISTTEISNIFFETDKQQRIWYSDEDAIQKWAGYNNFYDAVFDVGDLIKVTENAHWKSEFTYGEYEYRIEAWKGNYLWMGVGAEVGLYYRSRLDYRVNGQGYMNLYTCGGQFWVLPDEPVPTKDNLFSWKEFTLEISLYYQPDLKTKQLIFKRDAKSHWWLNGFRPDIGKIDPKNLTLDGSIVFPKKEMADAFKDGLKPKDKKIIKNTSVDGKKVAFSWSGA